VKEQMPLIDHQAMATRLRACPQYELPVASGVDRKVARVLASQIRSGALAAYRPRRSFLARWSADGQGAWTVVAAYVGNPNRRDDEPSHLCRPHYASGAGNAAHRRKQQGAPQ
jgi:hypothetical protein